MTGAPSAPGAPSPGDISLGIGLGAPGTATPTGGYQASPSITPASQAAQILSGGYVAPAASVVAVPEPSIPGSVVSPPPISTPFLSPEMDLVSPSIPAPAPPPPPPPTISAARQRQIDYGNRAERQKAAKIRARTKVRPLMG